MSKWVADKVERKSVEDLIPYDRNPKIHTDAQVERLASSIKQWGWTIPILVDEKDMVIAGHGRLFAAKLLKLDTVPTMTATGWSEEQKKAYVIADNRLSVADWDDELLRIEIENLKDMNFNLDFLGFGEELDTILFDNDSEIEMPDLADGDGSPFQQKTFTFHNEQVDIVDEAIRKAKKNPLVNTGLNENSNGNALTLICEDWLKKNNE